MRAGAKRDHIEAINRLDINSIYKAELRLFELHMEIPERSEIKSVIPQLTPFTVL